MLPSILLLGGSSECAFENSASTCCMSFALTPNLSYMPFPKLVGCVPTPLANTSLGAKPKSSDTKIDLIYQRALCNYL